MRIRMLTAVAVIALAVPAAARAEEGFYLGGGLGLSSAVNSTYEDAVNSNKIKLDDGFAGLISGGYQFASNWRAEAEFASRRNAVDNITGTGAAAPVTGASAVYSLMGNAIYGIPTGTKFTPYIGAGIGAARVKADNVGTTLASNVNDSDTVFAYQGIAGLEYDVTQNWKAGVDYRYFRTADTKFTSAALTDVSGDYANHTVLMSTRYLFPAAKAAPVMAAAPVAAARAVAAPPAAPSVPNNYIVFFDFDRAGVSEEANRIIAAAAANAQQARVTTIEVSGHADRSGGDRYNQRLSQRRADIVKNALLAQGIPADAIAVTARGESDPLVATADGVREAQNRRVQIVLK